MTGQPRQLLLSISIHCDCVVMIAHMSCRVFISPAWVDCRGFQMFKASSNCKHSLQALVASTRCKHSLQALTASTASTYCKHSLQALSMAATIQKQVSGKLAVCMALTKTQPLSNKAQSAPSTYSSLRVTLS